MTVPYTRTNDGWSPWSNPEYRMEIVEEFMRQRIAVGAKIHRIVPRPVKPSPIIRPSDRDRLSLAGLVGPDGKSL